MWWTMNKSSLSAGLVAFLLLASVSFAFDDIDASSSLSFSALRCEQTTHTLTLTNYGDEASTYNVELSGDDAGAWASAIPGRFALAPGASQDVIYALDTPCDAKGTQKLTSVFYSDAGFERAITADVVIGVPNNIDITPTVYKDTVGPCGQGRFALTLKNTASFDESYSISLIQPRDLALETTFSATRVDLAANGTEDITIDVTPTDCSQSGPQTLTARIKTRVTELQADLDLSLDILPKGIATVGTNVDRIVSGYNASVGKVDITNVGTSKTSYDISVDGPAWIKANIATLELAPDETGTVGLILSPTREQVPLGDYTVTVTAAVRGGRASYSKDITVRVYEPTWLKRQFGEHLGRTLLIIAGAVVILIILIVAIVKVRSYYASEEYATKKAEKARLRAERETAKKAEEDRRTKERLKEEERKNKEAQKIEAQKQKEADRKKREEEKRESEEYFERAKSAAERDLRKNYVLVSKRMLEGKESSYAWLWWVALIALVLVLATIAIVFPSIWTNHASAVIIGAGVALTIILTLIVAETARKYNQRVFRFKAIAPKTKSLKTGWHTGLGELQLLVGETLAKCVIGVQRGTRPLGFVPSEDTVYEYVTIEGVGVTDDDVESLGLRFAVPKRWLARRNIDPSKIRIARCNDGWRNLSTEIAGDDDKNYYFSAEATTLGNFAILGKPGKRTQQKPLVLPWVPIIVAIILVALIGGTYVLGLFAPPSPVPAIAADVKGIPAQYWSKNTAHQLNLSGVFIDPDGDQLTITYTPVEDIVLTIKDNTITFLPEKDFVGERSVQFTVTDGKGGKAKSNDVLLVVYDAPKPTLVGAMATFAKRYFIHVVAGVVLLVLVILAYEYRKPLQKFLDDD